MKPRRPPPPPSAALRGRPSLAERSAASGVPGAAELVAEINGVTPLVPAPEPVKHCWVSDPRWPGRRAGLLLTWRKLRGRWQGRVLLATEDGDVSISWIDSAKLQEVREAEPAES